MATKASRAPGPGTVPDTETTWPPPGPTGKYKHHVNDIEK